MAPRAFQTMLVGPMGTKDRLELESRVLAAALKQSFERGDSVGVSLAHRQIFLLLKAAKKAEDSGLSTLKGSQGRRRRVGSKGSDASGADSKPDPGNDLKSDSKPRSRGKKRVMPNIVWTEAEDDPHSESDNKFSENKFDDQDGEETGEELIVRQPLVDKPEVAAVAEEEQLLSESEPERGSDNVEISEVANDQIPESQKKSDEVVSSGYQSLGPFVFDENAKDAYAVLKVEQVSSFYDIHRSFLWLVKRLLVEMKKSNRKRKKELLIDLQQLWISHDVLTDPVTRTDYDFRILGLRGAPDVIIDAPGEEGESIIGSEVPLRIGELLQCAGLLEPAELEIAADMHKAMPEMLFGAFLVKQGFITDEDLEQVLMGQRLLKMGNMSVGTFQGCMKLWREDSVYIQDSAVSQGLIGQAEMERIVAQGLMDTDTEI
ncbi:MAG: hypothetical protein K8F91_12450, partial [Candidatus Obscuribacterales bacterium]|nr:hypothetical protein [Candidatus Obscuribacterales bacterium]